MSFDPRDAAPRWRQEGSLPIETLEIPKTHGGPMPGQTQNELLHATKIALHVARGRYAVVVREAPAAEAELCALEVKRCAEAVSLAITHGCSPCPTCKQHPHGIEQPGRRGTHEYEIGCLACKPFDHTDGTRREPRTRGGMMPAHAVDAWNAGPDFWLVAVDKALTVPEKQPAPADETTEG